MLDKKKQKENMEEQEGSGSRGANESREVMRGYFDKIQAVWSLCGHVQEHTYEE